MDVYQPVQTPLSDLYHPVFPSDPWPDPIFRAMGDHEDRTLIGFKVAHRLKVAAASPGQQSVALVIAHDEFPSDGFGAQSLM